MQFEPTTLILSAAAQREHFDGVRFDTATVELPVRRRRMRRPVGALAGPFGRTTRRSGPRPAHRMAVHG